MTYRRWKVPAAGLVDLTPEKARELIVTCFFEAQKGTFVRTKGRLGLPAADATVRDTVQTVVLMAFELTGGEFASPTRESLSRVVDNLAERSEGFGTPPDIIEHHRKEIEEVLRRL